MGTSVDANGRSILHKGHGSTHASAVPDVCKTPTPGGPVPIPYPNMAMDSNLTDGVETVKIEGNPLANISSKISTSTGDEAGSAGGGIMSSKIKGTCTWKMGSPDVKADGKSVVRFLDTTFHNGNSFNTSFIDQGGTGMGYADDFDGPCPICGQGPPEHAVPSILASSAAICADLIERLRNAPPATVCKRRKENGKKVWGGYMVGVMVCRHSRILGQPQPYTFATMSGTTTDGFTNIAGQTPGIHEVVPGGAVGVQQMAEANTSPALTSMKMLASALAAIMVVNAREAGVPGYSRYGTCAGAKLLGSSGHGPIAMTEMFFQPAHRDPWESPPYQYRVNGLNIGTRVYTSNDPSVGSCNTCQATLFMTMCPQRTCVRQSGN
jgi:hypothetical protein